MAGTEKLSNNLQCHVCFGEYQVNERILQCRAGHSVCQLCRSHLNKCPFCMAPYEGTRNYAVEEIVREMKGISASAPANVANVLPIPPTPPKYKTIMSLVPRPARQNYSNPWIKCNADNIPRNAIRGGIDHDNVPLYIGRAEHLGALIPGKVNCVNGLCYVAWGGKEHGKSNFEILQNIDGTWIPNSGGTIPIGAFAAGYTENGETLYMGRANIEGTLSVGKVQPSHGCCYLSYGGTEYRKQNYEIFVLDS